MYFFKRLKTYHLRIVFYLLSSLVRMLCSNTDSQFIGNSRGDVLLHGAGDCRIDSCSGKPPAGSPLACGL